MSPAPSARRVRFEADYKPVHICRYESCALEYPNREYLLAHYQKHHIPTFCRACRTHFDSPGDKTAHTHWKHKRGRIHVRMPSAPKKLTKDPPKPPSKDEEEATDDPIWWKEASKRAEKNRAAAQRALEAAEKNREDLKKNVGEDDAEEERLTEEKWEQTKLRKARKEQKKREKMDEKWEQAKLRKTPTEQKKRELGKEQGLPPGRRSAAPQPVLKSAFLDRGRHASRGVAELESRLRDAMSFASNNRREPPPVVCIELGMKKRRELMMDLMGKNWKA